MDVSRFLDPKPAPCAVFDSLAERSARPRFLVPEHGDWRAVTWGAFAREIRTRALWLRETGLEPGDRAAIYAANSVEWIAAALAIQSAGGVLVPVYPASTAEQAAYVLSHSDAKVVFVDEETRVSRVLASRAELPALGTVALLADRYDGDLDGRVVPWSRTRAADDAAAFQRMLDAVSLDAGAVMLYTSGTSGNPKGVPLTHRNVATNGRDWLEIYGPTIRENAVDLLWLPMSHIFGFGEACLGNTLGFTTYLADPATVLPRLPEVRPDVFMSVPAIWEKLAIQSAGDAAKLAAATGGRLSFCLSGGAGLKVAVKETFERAGIVIMEGYGLTECSPTLTLNRPREYRFDSVGKPLPSVTLSLAADGEILAKGPSVFAGYHKDPDATREAFDADGWFKTGDVGRFTEDGFLQIVDRKKEILVTAGGKNVPPANIENRFRDDPHVEHVVVYGDGKRYLVAGVWPRGDVPFETLAASVERVNASLASFETIKKFFVAGEPLSVENGLLTASLKVRRKHVHARFRDRFEALYEESRELRA